MALAQSSEGMSRQAPRITKTDAEAPNGRLRDLARRRKRAHTALLQLGAPVYAAFLQMEKAAYADGALPR